MNGRIGVRLVTLSFALSTLTASTVSLADDKIAAYYTEIKSGQDFERYSRTGPYADIVVELPAGKMVFWRGASYLPYWESAEGRSSVEEIVPRTGDGPKQRPDNVNTFSRVAIIESDHDKAIVYWRYLPEFAGKNPHFGVEPTKFVEEYFNITSDGKVTRTIRQGTRKIDDWRDALNETVQTFALTAAGIANVKTTLPRKTTNTAEAITEAEIQEDIPGNPVAWWRFDEARGDETVDSIKGSKSAIAGHKSLWKPGVSGTALQFDGYYTEVRLPSASAPSFSAALTAEAWVAVGAYPWNWTPIIQQTDDRPEQLIAVSGSAARLTGESDTEQQEEHLEVDEEYVDFDQNDLDYEGDTSLRVAKKSDFDLTNSDYTIIARIRTEDGGTVFAQAPKQGRYAPDAKSFYVAEGRLFFDIGWVGAVESSAKVDDGRWHIVALTFGHETGNIRLYVDGEQDAQTEMRPAAMVEDEQVLRIGFTALDFPDEVRGFEGNISHVAFFQRVLSQEEISGCVEGKVPTEDIVAFWNRFDHSEDKLIDATGNGHDARLEEVSIEESFNGEEGNEEEFEDVEDHKDEGEYEDENEGEGQDEDENFSFTLEPEDDTGYYLGLDGMGRAGFKIRVGDTWEELVSEHILERRRWYHVAGVYDGQSGLMTLYVDGTPVAEKRTSGGPIALSTKDVVIGKGKPRRPLHPVRKNTFIDSYALDGLLDEVRLHDVVLTSEQIRSIYERMRPSNQTVSPAPLETRALPNGRNTQHFGAHYDHLRFYETWDNLWRFGDHPDVVVNFDDSPCQFVFWRGCGYIPMLVNDKGHWYSNEFNETWNKTGGQGCQEPMSDKESYTNHVRIIEYSDARVVVHWRYPLIDVQHIAANYDEQTGWADWADWYYYIYPDGVAAKTMHLWTHGERNHEWQESMAIMGPNQHPEQVLETSPALMLVNLSGKVTEYQWENGPPEDLYLIDQKIHIVNYKSEYDPFTIGDFRGGDVYNGELTEYSVFPSWNHWPVAQIPSDGRYATYSDRTSHSSLTHVQLPTHKDDFGDRPFEQRILLEGMTNKAPDQLVPIARSWLLPPKMTVHSGGVSEGCDRGQRAYLLDATGGTISLTLKGSRSRPIVNPCFVVKNWGDAEAEVSIGGFEIAGEHDIRIGKPRTVRSHDLVVWVKLQSTSNTSFTIAAP